MHHNDLQKYACEVCNKQYKTKGGIKKHLKLQHQWDFDNEQETPSKNDHIALYRDSFMKCSLLLRDTNDAYEMGDGDIILLNAKFQMLLSRIGNHTKYQLWLFRFMAYMYCYSLLTPRMAYEYIWNCTANMHGNIGHDLPNDNLVEMLVQAVKKKIYAQGANATYKSARNAALTLQIQEEIFTNIQKEVNKNITGRRRPERSKLNDITAMVSELQSARVFDFILVESIPNFPYSQTSSPD
ncbi:uncharacterized protein LOC134697415 [Mytilus trossulus]|uniref:uncharacterized protein LOC134697415 n=1 Tax=Mytilus trossulus TaxID=6551 RepID=UPI003007972C